MAPELRHGLESAHYSNGPYGYLPCFDCECGDSFTGDSWAEVGEFYDAHLQEVGAPPCGTIGVVLEEADA